MNRGVGAVLANSEECVSVLNTHLQVDPDVNQGPHNLSVTISKRT